MTTSKEALAREHVYIDLLHIGDDDDEEKDALVVVDASSRYFEVYPVLDMTSESVIDALSMNWFQRHGAPTRLTSDNGRQFTSGNFKTFMEKNGVLHIFSSAMHPQSELVEIGVKLFKDKL